MKSKANSATQSTLKRSRQRVRRHLRKVGDRAIVQADQHALGAKADTSWKEVEGDVVELTPETHAISENESHAESPENDSRTTDADEERTLSETEKLVVFLCKQVSRWFVRSKNQFYSVERPNSSLTQAEVKTITFRRIRVWFPHIELTQEVQRAVFQRAIVETHDDPEQSIPIWNGTTCCFAGVADPVIPDGEMVTLNTWKTPSYRKRVMKAADTRIFDDFLERIFRHEIDRRIFKDWLSWCLQNEEDKPAFAMFLYSRKKGTGKSTLCQLISKLFGEENSITQNSISKLTSRFNKPLLDSKLVISEELQLKPDSQHGNTLKTYITEKVTTSEVKGKEVEKVKQCCCFLFTTNHLPLWIEGGERRYYVIDVDHDGHAAGPEAEEFGNFIAELNRWMESEDNLAALYKGLMEHCQSNEFNARSLNLSQIQTPVMKQIMGASREVQLARLEEYLEGAGRFAMPQEELAKWFVEQLKTNQNRIRHMMPELGWRPEKAKWGGADYARSLWVHPDYQVTGGRVRGPGGYDEPICPTEEEIEIIE